MLFEDEEDSVYLNLVLLIYLWNGFVVRFMTRIGVTDTRRKLNAVVREDVGYGIWRATRFIYIYSSFVSREFLFGVIKA